MSERPNVFFLESLDVDRVEYTLRKVSELIDNENEGSFVDLSDKYLTNKERDEVQKLISDYRKVDKFFRKSKNGNGFKGDCWKYQNGLMLFITPMVNICRGIHRKADDLDRAREVNNDSNNNIVIEYGRLIELRGVNGFDFDSIRARDEEMFEILTNLGHLHFSLKWLLNFRKVD